MPQLVVVALAPYKFPTSHLNIDLCVFGQCGFQYLQEYGSLTDLADCLSSMIRSGKKWRVAHRTPRHRISVRAQDPDIRADWHGVVIHDDKAIVLAEETMRLMAFP